MLDAAPRTALHPEHCGPQSVSLATSEGGWAHGEVMVITPWHSHVIGRYRLLQPLDKSVIQLEGSI